MSAVSKKRDIKIDFYRGVGAIGVISIHTAFWSGESYVPSWFQSLTLLVDVPYFFFIAGKSACFHEGQVVKAGKSLGRMWLKWICSVSILAIICQIFSWSGIADIKDLLWNYCFHVSFESLPVISGSIWFMPYYIVVTLVNQVVLAVFLCSGEKYEDYKKWFCGILLFAFCWTVTGHDFLGVNQYNLFYSFYWMLGIISQKFCIKNVKIFIGILFMIITGYFASCYLTALPYVDLQQSKFPPQLPYFFASMLLIVFTVYFDKYIARTNKYLVHIGKNAFYYYIAQGVSSSLLYHILPVIKTEMWFIKWGIAFVANLLIAIIIAEILAIVYNTFYKLYEIVKIDYWGGGNIMAFKNSMGGIRAFGRGVILSADTSKKLLMEKMFGGYPIYEVIDFGGGK